MMLNGVLGLSILLIIFISTFTQFQLDLFEIHEIVLHYVKIMRIERDQLFIQLHDVSFIDFVKQRLHLLPDLMRVFDSIDMKMNLPRDIDDDDPLHPHPSFHEQRTFPYILLDMESLSSYISIILYS